jgi:hypothetical protein
MPDPNTITTVETFPKTATAAQVEKERKLRIKAGAISSDKRKLHDGSWEIETVWNVIGAG